jgi:hypothetical protein
MHRFAIQIRDWRRLKEAIDEDRVTAMGELRKTNKYGMKMTTRKRVTGLDEFMQHPEVSKTINERLASLVVLYAHDTLPAGSSKHLDHYPS